MKKRHSHQDTHGLSFQLPPNITVTRQPLPNGLAYVFRDADLGELGRLAVEGTATGETRISSEVSGFPDDPMMQRRLEVFEPLCKKLTHILESALGKGQDTAPPVRTTPQPMGQIPCEESRCETCGKIVAFLIFADDATDAGRFEDCARLMYPHYVRHNVPTYIIGPELGDGPMEHRPANILQVWPQRSAMECLRPDEFNPRIEKLASQHCGQHRMRSNKQPASSPKHGGEQEKGRGGTVIKLLPKLTMNRQFVTDFLSADVPCFAMGVVEERKMKRAFLALRPADTIPDDITEDGFNFGHSVLGSIDFEVVHFAFEFYGFQTFNALVNPNNPLAQTVLNLMIEGGEYFFFAINPRGSVTAFKTEMQRNSLPDLTGIKENIHRIKGSRTTASQYEKAVSLFVKKPDPPGIMLNWVCRDNVEYLDLTGDVITLAPF